MKEDSSLFVNLLSMFLYLNEGLNEKKTYTQSKHEPKRFEKLIKSSNKIFKRCIEMNVLKPVA